MAGVTAALAIGSAIMSAYGSYQEGKAQKAQADANAQIYNIQAQNIAESQKIVDSQYRTKADMLRGEATATAARGGLKISGSTANSISQSITALQMDSSIEKHNLEVEKQKAYSAAALEKLKGRQAYSSGLMKAGQSALAAGSDYYSRYWNGNKTNSTGSNWWNTAKGKISSWSNTKLSGGLPTTNSQILNKNSGILNA